DQPPRYEVVLRRSESYDSYWAFFRKEIFKTFDVSREAAYNFLEVVYGAVLQINEAPDGDVFRALLERNSPVCETISELPYQSQWSQVIPERLLDSLVDRL